VRETIRSTLGECSIADWHGEIETRRRSKKRERKGKRKKREEQKERKKKKTTEDAEEEEEGEEEEAGEEARREGRGKEKVEGPREVNVRLCDHWRMHSSLPVSQN